MKMSSTVKEYIKRRIKEITDKPIKEVEEYEKAKKELEQEINIANNKIINYAYEVMQEIKNPCGFIIERKHSHDFLTSYYGYDYDYGKKHPLYIACEKAKIARTNEVENLTQDTLAEMELGGTKAELEEKLTQIAEQWANK